MGTIEVEDVSKIAGGLMDKKTTNLLLTILVILFIAMGDRVLPKPLSTASLSVRTTMNNFLIGLFPSGKTKDVNGNREKALEQQLNSEATKQ